MNDSHDARRHYLATKLAAHTATPEERDEALGTILMTLWSKNDVNEMIEKKHEAMCKDCPAKKLAEEGGAKEGVWTKITLELAKIVGWSIVILGALAGASKLLDGGIK